MQVNRLTTVSTSNPNGMHKSTRKITIFFFRYAKKAIFSIVAVHLTMPQETKTIKKMRTP